MLNKKILLLFNYLAYYLFIQFFSQIIKKKNSCKYILNPKFEIDKQIILGKYEVMVTNVLKSVTKKNFVCMDVGANFGYYSILLSKLIGKEGIVFAFEPAQYQVKRLEKNSELNNCKNLVIIDKAVGDKTTKVNFYEYPPFSTLEGHSSCEKEALEHLENNRYLKKRVQQITLDDFIINKNLKTIDFIKMDIEGSEIKCLEGSKNIIKKFRPIIIFEFGNQRNKMLNFELNDYLFKFNNYNFYSITNGPQVDKLLTTDVNFLNNVTDFLAIPREKFNENFYTIVD